MNKKTPEVEPTPERRQVYLVFVALCQAVKDGKTYQGAEFLPLTEEEFEQRTCPISDKTWVYADKKLLRRLGRPGNIYQFDMPVDQPSDGHRLYLNTIRWVGRIETDERVSRWQATYDAERLEESRKHLESKEKRVNKVHADLGYIRLLYQALPSAKRPALLASIIHFITNPIRS